MMSELLVLVTLLVKENLSRWWRCVHFSSSLVNFLTKQNLFTASQGHLSVFWIVWDTHVSNSGTTTLCL